MNFTGRNLQLVYLGLGHAISDLNNDIAVCPDILRYERELEEIEELMNEMKELQIKIYNSPHFEIPEECKEKV